MGSAAASRDDVGNTVRAHSPSGALHQRLRKEGSNESAHTEEAPTTTNSSSSSSAWQLPDGAAAKAEPTCGRNCVDEMLGNEVSCRTYRPEKNQRTLSAGGVADYVDRGRPSTYLVINATSSELELLAAGFGALQANFDLVEWAFCLSWLDFDLTAKTRLTAMIWGVAPPIIVLLDAGRISHDNGLALFGTYTLWVNRGGQRWAPLLQLWESGDESRRACATIEIATFLLHEMTHLAGISLIDLDDSACAQSYMIGNAFQWMAFQRFPNGTDNDCCDDLGDDKIYGCGGRSFYAEGGECDLTNDSVETWGEVVEEWWDDVLAGMAAGESRSAGGGFDFALCQICPEVCCNGGPCHDGPREGAWESCLSKHGAHQIAENEFDILDPMRP